MRIILGMFLLFVLISSEQSYGQLFQFVPGPFFQQPMGCKGTPWGDVPEGYSNLAYSSTTPAGTCAANSETRICLNGVLSGSYTATTCTAGCTGTPWGNVTHGYSNTAYSTSSPTAACSTVDETRTCSNGSLSGSFTTTSCNDGCPAQAITWGSGNCGANTLARAHGGTGTRTNTSPGYSGTKDYTCTNGVISLSGGSCTATCGGASVGGYCWYWGAANQSCTSLCSGHGGYDSATNTYAGSSGTVPHCKSVLNALGKAGDPSDDGMCPGPYGCGEYGGSSLRRCNYATTNAGSANPDYRRACACQY